MLSNPPAATSFPWGRALWLASVALGAVLCAAVLGRPVRWLLGFVADDAFYYLQTARHLAATGQSTFDGLNPTNGYHPGWMLLMTLCAGVFHDRVTLLRVCLGMEFVTHLAGAWLLARVLRPFLGVDWAWLGAAGWLLNPYPLSLALNGVEAPLAVFCVLLVVRCWQVRIGPLLGGDAPLPARNLALLGAAVAAAIYARTDQGLLVPGVILALLVVRRSGGGGGIARAAAIFLGAVGVCLLPWVVFSYVTVGTVQQDSGAMKMLWHHRLWQGRGEAALAEDVWLFLRDTWLAYPLVKMLGGVGVAPAQALLVSALVLLASLTAARRQPEAGALGALTAGAALSLAAAGLLYGSSLTDFQRWHFAVPALLIYAILFGWPALALRRRLPARGQAWVAAVVFALLCVPLARALRPLQPNYPWQQDVYDSLPHFNALVPPGARVGCLNAGIPAYFSDRPVINLDGLVNHTAVAYWTRGEFDAYLRDQRIQYIADEERSLARAQRYSQSRLPLWTLSVHPLRGWDPPDRLLWRVDLSRLAAR